MSGETSFNQIIKNDELVEKEGERIVPSLPSPRLMIQKQQQQQQTCSRDSMKDGERESITTQEQYAQQREESLLVDTNNNTLFLRQEERKLGPRSPFSSSIRHRLPLSPTTMSTTSSTKENHTQTQLSLIPCRKVSVVVHITPFPSDDALCIFPLIHINKNHNNHDDDFLTTTHLSDETRELILVKPTAFGTHIPARITLETCRLVSQVVAKASTEDWARLFHHFDSVLWPRGGDCNTATTSSSSSSLAMANDLLRNKPRVCFGMGQSSSSLLFGNIMAAASDDDKSMMQQQTTTTFGMLESTLEHIWNNSQEHQVVCTMSLLEIVDEDVLRDLVLSKSLLRIRHYDHKGAVVENLSEHPVDSLAGLRNLLKHAFLSKRRLVEQTKFRRGHVLATVKVWKGQECTIFLLVDLAAASGGEASETHNVRISSSQSFWF